MQIPQIKFFNQEKSFKKGGLSANPDFFWHILLFLGFFLIALSLVFGVFLFVKIKKENFLETANTTKKKDTISIERINKVLEYFDTRKSKSLDILNSPSPVIDPSL